MKKIMTLPNAVTSLRIVGAVVLFWLSPLSTAFFIVYSICGLSDLLDGTIARLTKQTSEFGAKLDSIADLLFYFAMLIKILPILWELLPKSIWIAVALILIIRSLSYLVAAIRHKHFASLHTYLNKATGSVLFAVPYFLRLPFAKAYCWFVCLVAMAASTEELLMHLKARKYTSDTQTIFALRHYNKFN